MREIEVFLAVAKNQNISKTAEELYISQSALSSWIARMEEYCGVRLFRRTNRGVVLTPEGEQLYARLDIAYKRFKVSVEEICETYQQTSTDIIRIGCLNRLAVMETVQEVMKRFPQKKPERKVSIERFNFHELRDRLLCDQLDLAITISSDIEPYDEFGMLPLAPFPVYFLVQKGTQKIGDLNGRTLIVEAPTNRKWAEQICAENNITPDRVRYVNSYILMTTLAAAGDGFAIDGKIVTQNIYTPTTALIPAETSADVKIVLAWKKEQTSDVVKEFLSFCPQMENNEVIT